MSVKDFVTALQCCIREEFIAVSETVENVIRVRFLDGKLINIIVTD